MRRRLAQSHGGPTGGDGSVFERYLRLQLDAGDAFERALTAEVGAARARAWRDAAGPRFTLTGCDPDHALFRSER